MPNRMGGEGLKGTKCPEIHRSTSMDLRAEIHPVSSGKPYTAPTQLANGKQRVILHRILVTQNVSSFGSL